MTSSFTDVRPLPNPPPSNGGGRSDPLAPPNNLSILRLCQLVSPALPIGAYHFSQGFEYAVHAEWISDEQSACEWIIGVAAHSLGTLDVPILLRLYDAWASDDAARARHWSQTLIASRETQELRAEERHVGKALAKVLVELEITAAHDWIIRDHTTYAAMFALACTQWEIDRNAAAQAYLWTWSENQVLAALKLLPIGQSAGQRMLNRVLQAIPSIATQAMTLRDDVIGIATPLHGMASAWHESQYSRLFRS